jgi:uncharacterized alkaline shock family protein YloU
MTEPNPGIPAQTPAAAAPDSAAPIAPAHPVTFQPMHPPTPAAPPAAEAVSAPVAVAAPATVATPAEAPVAERAAQFVDRAGEVIGEAADKAHDAFEEAAEKAGEKLSAAADKAQDVIADAAKTAITRIRNNAELPAARGRTTIANEVVEKIAGIAAREVPGVYDLGGDVARMFSAVRERLHIGEESNAQGVSVRLEGATAEIDVTIVIEFGFVISSVTDKVREKVISSVEALLQLEVKSVDVLVDDIHVEQDGPVGNDAERAHGYNSGTQGIIVGE